MDEGFIGMVDPKTRGNTLLFGLDGHDSPSPSHYTPATSKNQSKFFASILPPGKNLRKICDFPAKF
jgi:hypothetical protein